MFEPAADLPYLFSTGQPKRTGKNGQEMAFVTQTIDVNGCKLIFQRAGKGVPLIYLHGTDGLAEWPSLLDTLAANASLSSARAPAFAMGVPPQLVRLANFCTMSEPTLRPP